MNKLWWVIFVYKSYQCSSKSACNYQLITMVYMFFNALLFNLYTAKPYPLSIESHSFGIGLWFIFTVSSLIRNNCITQNLQRWVALTSVVSVYHTHAWHIYNGELNEYFITKNTHQAPTCLVTIGWFSACYWRRGSEPSWHRGEILWLYQSWRNV